MFVIRERLGNVFSMGLKSCWMFLRVVDTWVALRKKCGGKKNRMFLHRRVPDPAQKSVLIVTVMI